MQMLAIMVTNVGRLQHGKRIPSGTDIFQLSGTDVRWKKSGKDQTTISGDQTHSIMQTQKMKQVDHGQLRPCYISSPNLITDYV